MAKTTGPLCSFAAAGTLAKLLTFRPARRTTIVTRAIKHQAPPSQAQLDHRARGSQAALAWQDITEPELTLWQTIATARHLPIFATYLQEFQRQNSSIYNPPQIPAE